MNDPIADMLARIRNAIMTRHTTLDMPGSRIKVGENSLQLIACRRVVRPNELDLGFLDRTNRIELNDLFLNREVEHGRENREFFHDRVRGRARLLPLSDDRSARLPCR